MTSPFVRAILASCALACAAAPALADSIVAGGSSAGVSASSAGSVSLKGSSNSIEGASASSSRGDKTALVQDGTYRVTAVTPDPHAGTVRLGLAPQGMEGAQAFVLNVPVGAFGGEVPSAGDTLQAQRRDYGVQFARADTPFYLVLADAWSAELDSRPLTQ